MRDGRKRGKPNHNKQEIRDECRSLEVPTCSLVKQVTEDIVPSSNGAISTGEPTLFGRITLQFLLEQQRNEMLQREKETRSDTAKKKSKKRRKKKKGRGGVQGDSTLPSTRLPSEQPVEAQDSPPPVAAAPPASEPSATLQNKITMTPEEMVSELLDANVIRWMNSLLQKKNSNPTTNRDLESFAITLSSSPTIAVADVTKALRSINCPRCRESAENSWRAMFPGQRQLGAFSGDGTQPVQRIVLQPLMISSELCRIGFEDSDVEQAFNYVALEEGLPEDVHGKDALILQPTEEGGETPLSLKLSRIPDVALVRQLLLGIILPSGLPESELTSEYELSEPEFNEIVRKASDLEKEVLRRLADLNAPVSKLHRELEMAPPTQTSFDPMESQTLRKYDATADEILSTSLEVLLRVTEILGPGPGGGSSVLVQIRLDQLWATFNSVVETMVNAAIAHEGKLLQLDKRPGKVPEMALSKAHRVSYRNMLKEKCKAVENLFQDIKTKLNKEINNYGTSMLRELVTSYSFQQIVLNTSLDKDGLETSHIEVVKAYSELTQTVEHHGTVKKIIDKQEERCNRIMGLLTQLSSRILQDFDANENLLKGMDVTRWRCLRREYSEIQEALRLKEDNVTNSDTDNEDDEEEKAKNLADLRQKVSLLASNVFQQWRCLRVLKSVVRSLQVPVLPTRLRRWMNRANDLVGSNGAACRGGGGKRRLAGILSAQIYLWLAERCKEWHAELTKQELLKAINESDILNDVDTNEILKPSRSSKKRKKKRMADPTPLFVSEKKEPDRPETPDSIDSDDTPLEREITANGEASQDNKQNGFPRETSFDVDHDASAHHEDGETTESDGHDAMEPPKESLPEESTIPKEEAATQPEASTEINSQEAPQPNTHQNEKEIVKVKPLPVETSRVAACNNVSNIPEVTAEQASKDTTIRVGVIGPSGLQSAEDFLMERFIAILAMKESNGAPIMQL